VLYLLLDANYNAMNDKDFFGKTPRDYSNFSSNNDLENIFSQSKDRIATVASRIRNKKQPSLDKLLLGQRQFDGFLQKPYLNIKSQQESQVFATNQIEEELAQAMVEADTAYAQRDVALAENEEMKKRIRELEEMLEKKEQDMEEMENLSERNRQLSKLLKHFEDKDKALQHSLSEKDRKIEALMNEARKSSEEKETEASALATKYKQEKEKLMRTVSALSEKLSAMTSRLNDTVCELEQSQDEGTVDSSIHATQSELQCLSKFKIYAEEKMKSLEEMVEVYKSALNALQSRCHALEQQCTLQNDKSNVSKIKKLESELADSEEIRKALEKEISLLTSYTVKTNERVEILEEMLDNYRIEVKKLEDGYYRVTEQLIQRTMVMRKSSSRSET
jgi:chromosome segregation ATPase